jgi:TRAP-type C4-dicarboxylate transport system permease small subunit
LEQTAAQARRLSQIPLWVGIILIVLSASGMYAVMQSAGYNFWFYCLMLPLFLGVAVTAFGGWSRTARWLFVSVDRSQQDDWPKRIFLGFPLPLGLAGWFLRTFGNHIEGLKQTNVDEVVQAISATKAIKEPLIVNVDEGEDGERVQVYIG